MSAYLDDNPKTVFGQAKPGIADIPPIALLIQGMAHRDGRMKYGRMNWRERTVTASIYYEACVRHLASWWDGEECAPDSGVHHLGHAIACINILIDMLFMAEADPEFSWNDDRPPPGSLPRNIESLIWPIDPETGEPRRPEPVEDVDVAGAVETPTPLAASLMGAMRIKPDPEGREELEGLVELALRVMSSNDLDEAVSLLSGGPGYTDTEPEPFGLYAVDVRPGITPEGLRELIGEFLSENPPQRLAELSTFQEHMRRWQASAMNQAERTRLAFYLDCRAAGIGASVQEMDDVLSARIGGEQ